MELECCGELVMEEEEGEGRREGRRGVIDEGRDGSLRAGALRGSHHAMTSGSDRAASQGQ
jgi:hypothetical protein